MGKSSKKGCFLLKYLVKSEGPDKTQIGLTITRSIIIFEKIDKLFQDQLSEIYQNWIFGGAVRIRTSSTNLYSIRRRVWHGYHEPIKVIWY
jgi:hypothetical protein